jgi:hypothetical protein
VGKRASGVFVVAIVIFGGCGKSGTPGSQAAPTPKSSAAPTTTGRPPSTTTPPPPPEFSFDDSVPPPKLVNTGTNYVEILKSLERYGNWAAAHRPDPALVVRINARGTKLYSAFALDLTRLRDNRKRLVETLGSPSTYKILSTTPDAFSARVTEDILVHKTVVSSGAVTSRHDYSERTIYLMLAVLIGSHWYLASVEVERPSHIHL